MAEPIPLPVPHLDESADWIDQFLAYTDGIPTPDIYRLWAGISTISAVMERRTWAKVARGSIYPNLYILLVGPPGVGKTQAIFKVLERWRGIRDIHVAPNSVTKASLVDAVAKSSRRLLVNGELKEFHSLLVGATEFGVLVPSHDLEFLNTLNELFDNIPSFREERRHLGNKQIDIPYPQLSIIAGTQPSYLANLLPEQAWGMGFMTRMVMVYAGVGKSVDLFTEVEDEREDLKVNLVKRLTRIAGIWGQFTWDQDARQEIERWSRAGCPPQPDHSKLEAYSSRRTLHVIKLAMTAAISRSSRELNITLRDLNRARDWLLHAEQLMPDIFREMVQRSDATVLQELHFFMWQLWVKEKRPIHESRLLHFLSNRLPSEKVVRLLQLAEKANVINRVAGSETYTPRPKHDHGVE